MLAPGSENLLHRARPSRSAPPEAKRSRHASPEALALPVSIQAEADSRFGLIQALDNMKSKIPVLLLLLLSVVNISFASAPEPKAPAKELSCIIGPAIKTFGGSQWNVYGCNDGRSVAVVSAAGSKAAPFYFFFAWGSDGMELNGEGNGNKQATDAAFEELKPLTDADIALLYQEANSITGASSGK